MTLRRLRADCQHHVRRARLHIDVEGDELAISGALPRIERVAKTNGQSR
jgi:hypothetical protein